MGRQMGLSGYSHALRAVVLAWGMVWFGPAADLTAGTLDSTGQTELTVRSDEPFGLFASTLSWGGVREKWRGVERKLDDESVQLALCDGDRERCVSPAALLLLAIVDKSRAREGRARLGEINRAINLAIRPMSDLAQHGEIDVWRSPLVTFKSGAGDCEDYAIAKFVALRLAGVSPDDLRIVIMHDTIPRRRRGAARRPLAHTGQSPHGYGRGRVCQELPAVVCHRSIRRHAVCRRTIAGGRTVRSVPIGRWALSLIFQLGIPDWDGLPRAAVRRPPRHVNQMYSLG